jgi:integrase
VVPVLFFRFWTGCRPSETSALRESDVDLKLGTVSIHRSRDEGSESTPKTKRSKRTIHLYPNVLGVLREFGPVKAKARPDDYFFTGPSEVIVPIVRGWPPESGKVDCDLLG